MGRKGEYMSLSVPYDRYLKLRRQFDRYVSSEDSFTQWYVDNGEGAIMRMKYLQDTFKGLEVIKINPGMLIINNSKTDQIVKVSFDKDGLKCSDKTKEAQRYIQFALLHTEFRPSND